MRRTPDFAVAAAAAVAAMLAAACVRQPPEAVAPPAPHRVVLDEAAASALADLLRIEDERTFDFYLVSRYLSDSVPEVRGRAALAAGRIRDQAALPLLIHALGNDPDGSVRARAAFALGLLGDTSATVINALSVATAVEMRSATDPRTEAVAALGRLGSSAGRPAIDAILTDERAPAQLVHEALLAAWRLPADPVTLRNIALRLKSSDAETRWRAAYALARPVWPASVQTLLDAVNDADARVRANAVRGLRAASADSAGFRERALAALLIAARDSHPHVRITAINLLPAYRANARTVPVLATALEDSIDNVAVAAAAALGQTADPAASAALGAIVSSKRADGLRTAALHAWMRSDPEAAARTAIEWSDSARWILRLHAARALARAYGEEAATALRKLARDSYYLVAAESVNSLRTATDTIHHRAVARNTFLEQLAAPHPLVRAAAIRGIAATAGPAEFDLLLNAYAYARNDSIPDAALAAVRALARVRSTGLPVERSFFLRFADDGAPRFAAVFQAIADSIGTPPATWQPPRVQEPRTDEFYRDIVRRYVVPVLAGAQPIRASITTTHGDIVLELASAEAPLTVHNFVTLAERGYYSASRWHRVVPNFVIQDGDPRGDGSGGPGYAIRDELNQLRYDRGALGMALSGPDTGGSQYFITHSPQPHLDGGYTIFGRVSSGMDVVDRVVQEDPILFIRVIR